MITYIIMGISLLLDGILSNFLPYMINDLSYFYPMFTLMSIILIYPFYKKEPKKYLLTIFILGIIYDLFYTNLLIFDGLIFVLIGLVVKIIYQNMPTNFFTIILYALLGIIIYEVLTSLVFIAFQLVPINYKDIIYKISHSLILNIIYIEIMFLIIKILPKKYTSNKIN